MRPPHSLHIHAWLALSAASAVGLVLFTTPSKPPRWERIAADLAYISAGGCFLIWLAYFLWSIRTPRQKRSPTPSWFEAGIYRIIDRAARWHAAMLWTLGLMLAGSLSISLAGKLFRGLEPAESLLWSIIFSALAIILFAVPATLFVIAGWRVRRYGESRWSMPAVMVGGWQALLLCRLPIEVLERGGFRTPWEAGWVVGAGVFVGVWAILFAVEIRKLVFTPEVSRCPEAASPTENCSQ